MSNEETPDGQIGEALIIRVIQDQMMHIVTGGTPSFVLPEVQPLNNEAMKMVDELSQAVKVIGDQLDHNQTLKNLINDLAKLADKKIFSELVKGVFNDSQVNWGRIIVLFYAVGKLAVKMVLRNLPGVFSEILDSCLVFFRTKLLIWIRNVGGWISSISALTEFSVECVTASASSLCSGPSAKVLVAFVWGTLLGGAVVWKLSRE